MSTPGLCRDCVFWGDDLPWKPKPGLHHCRRLNECVDGYHSEDGDFTVVHISASEYASVETAPTFGCTLFEAKAEGVDS